MTPLDALNDLLMHAVVVREREASSYTGGNYNRSAYYLAERVLQIALEAKQLVEWCRETGSQIVLTADSKLKMEEKANGRSKKKAPSKRKKRA